MLDLLGSGEWGVGDCYSNARNLDVWYRVGNRGTIKKQLQPMFVSSPLANDERDVLGMRKWRNWQTHQT